MSSSCNCESSVVSSWYDWQTQPPQSPLDSIARVALAGTPGSFARTAFPVITTLQPITFGANIPFCTALQTDNQLAVALAAQWNFSHLTANSSAPPPLRKVLFLRGGIEWQNTIEIDFGSDPASNVVLALRENFGTRGDAQGTMPLFTWSAPQQNVVNLDVTFSTFGSMNVLIIGTILGVATAFEMEWVIVP